MGPTFRLGAARLISIASAFCLLRFEKRTLRSLFVFWRLTEIMSRKLFVCCEKPIFHRAHFLTGRARQKDISSRRSDR
jgi:hypothetical protein